MDNSVRTNYVGVPHRANYQQQAQKAKQTVKEFALAHKNQKKPYLIILGNEEHGISDIVQKNCDELVIIPWGGMNAGVKESLVDSLNVAQAASVIFYELMN